MVSDQQKAYNSIGGEQELSHHDYMYIDMITMMS